MLETTRGSREAIAGADLLPLVCFRLRGRAFCLCSLGALLMRLGNRRDPMALAVAATL